MKTKKGPDAASTSRRRDIISAALACFSAIGFSETNMEDIRRRSGASTGSIYHHFRSKEQLAAEVYIEGIRVYQEELMNSLAGCTGPQEGVLALINRHLAWVKDHDEWSRYLFQKRHSMFMESAEGEISSLNRTFGQRLLLFFGEHMRTGSVKPLPADIMASLIFGPCMEYTRQYLSGVARTPMERAAEVLGNAAWQTLEPGNCPAEALQKRPFRKGGAS